MYIALESNNRISFHITSEAEILNKAVRVSG